MRSLTQWAESYLLPKGLFRRITQAYYRRIIANEVTLATITRHDRVLFIGAGALPLSAIELVRQTGAQVTAVDHNAEMIRRAQQALDAFACEGVTLTHEDGVHAELSGYTVIILANQLTQKTDVITHIQTHAHKGTKILVRKPPKGCPLSTKPTIHHRFRWMTHTALCIA